MLKKVCESNKNGCSAEVPLKLVGFITEDKMIIIITYDEHQNLQSGNWLLCCLTDLDWALSRRLLKDHNQKAKVVASYLPGKVELKVTGSDINTVKPYMDALLEGMIKIRFRVLISYKVNQNP